MKKNTFKLHILKPDGAVSSYDYNDKPTFQDMYQLVGCDMLQPSTAYLPKYSNRKDGYVEFYMDEEFYCSSRELATRPSNCLKLWAALSTS